MNFKNFKNIDSLLKYAQGFNVQELQTGIRNQIGNLLTNVNTYFSTKDPETTQGFFSVFNTLQIMVDNFFAKKATKNDVLTALNNCQNFISQTYNYTKNYRGVGQETQYVYDALYVIDNQIFAPYILYPLQNYMESIKEEQSASTQQQQPENWGATTQQINLI